MQDATNLPNNVAGQFGNGNPATNIKGTILLSNFQNDWMNNILEVIVQAGTGMTDGVATDLVNAINSLVSNPVSPPITLTGGAPAIIFDSTVWPSTEVSLFSEGQHVLTIGRLTNPLTTNATLRLLGQMDVEYQVSTDTVFRSTLQGFAPPQFQITGPGDQLWAPGGLAFDVRIRRSAVNTLRLDNAAGGSGVFEVVHTATTEPAISAFKNATDTQPSVALASIGAIVLGPGGPTAPDSRIRSGGTNIITIDDNANGDARIKLLNAASSIAYGVFLASGDTQPTVALGDNSAVFGVGGSTSPDTRIQRTSGGTLTVDDNSSGNGTLRSNSFVVLSGGSDQYFHQNTIKTRVYDFTTFNHGNGVHPLEVDLETETGILVSFGTNDSTAASKLIDSGATFSTDGVSIGDIVRNITDTTETTVTNIDSETQLALAGDIFTGTGKDYRVDSDSIKKNHAQLPVGFTAATPYFATAHMDLPNAARINTVTLYGHTTQGGDTITAILRSLDNGVATNLSAVITITAQGGDSNGSTSPSALLDTTTKSYILRVSGEVHSGGAVNDIRLYQVKVEYEVSNLSMTV